MCAPPPQTAVTIGCVRLSRCRPSLAQRNPPIDLATVMLIAGPEYSFQMRLLVEQHEQMKRCCDAHRIDREGRRLEQERPSADDGQDSHVHRIARVLGQRAHHELLRWINWCRRPST